MNVTQPTVPFWFAATILVLTNVVSAALAFSDPNIAFITPTVRFALFLVNVGLTTLATVLNIKKSEQ